MAISKAEAQKKIGHKVRYVKDLGDAFVFDDVNIPSDADIGGRYWVMKESGEVLENPFLYVKASSKAGREKKATAMKKTIAKN